jgi:hypothetical protein
MKGTTVSMSRPVWILLIAGLIAGPLGGACVVPATGSDRDAGEHQPAMGILLGQVTQRPMAPVERVGRPVPPAPVAGAQITISATTGQRVATVVTDDQGRYRVELPSGTYRVEMVRVGRFGFTKDLPATVTLPAGEAVRRDVSVDSGIR